MVYAEKQTDYDRLSNQLYYDNILLVSNGQNIDWTENKYTDSYRVYIEIEQNKRALIKDTSKWTPPMLSGYYPQDDEKELVAVIGKNVEETIYLDDKGDQWISCMGQEFRVVGIVGAEYATSCDDLVILFGMNFKEELANNTIIVDVETTKGAKKISEDLMKEYPEVQIQSGIIKGTSRITKSSYFYKLLCIEVLFITCFSVLIFGKYRHEKYKDHYKVYQICGLPMSTVLFNAELEILLTNIISLFIASSSIYLLGLFTMTRMRNLIGISIAIAMMAGIIELGLFIKENFDFSINDKH